LLTVLASISLASCRLMDDRMSKQKIFTTVESNLATIQEDIENNDFTNTLKIKGIQEVNVGEEIIEFYCGGAGFGPSTSYCGFYYTTDDDISAVWCAGPAEQIIKEGDGFVYREEGGDNYYYTEKICDNFYFYESSF